MSSPSPSPIRVVVSGSFRKHWAGVRHAVQEFVGMGATVLSPLPGLPTGETGGFVVLDTDIGTHETIQGRHLEAISIADLLYVVAPDGYVGQSVSFEIGYGTALGLPVWASEPPAGTPSKWFVQVGSAGAALRSLGEPRTPDPSSMRRLQRYYEAKARQRGFSDETPAEGVMLLVEEVGELARAVRKDTGVAVTAGVPQTDVSNELADCLIYLIHLANILDIDLASGFVTKEAQNELREWHKS